MPDEAKVYLDHLLDRENLRYRRSEELVTDYPQDKQTTLRLGDLTGERGKYIRKPDFQRATWAWNPEECVSLLESIVNYQVVPSIIMWTSPQNGYDYILDGGHRVSVVLAWLKDDWGEKYGAEHIDEDEQRNAILEASREVRRLVRARVGDIQTYKAAEDALARAVRERKSPGEVLDDATFQRGLFYQSLLKGDISFHILWVKGDYKNAEQSFLKINKSGRQLTDWETMLVENRNSSFARSVMSISSGSTAPHYWPDEFPGSTDAFNATLKQKAAEIIESVRHIQTATFQPPYTLPIQRIQLPLMVASIPDRPRFIAELLTITEGFRGQEPETQALLKKNPDAEPSEIVQEGWKIVRKANEILDHLIGPSNQPKSLGVVPALYFYTDAGRYVRSLLYGFVYWMFLGNEDDILNRKRLFCAYRAAFEEIIKANKADIIGTLSRRTGSGPEVTVQTAHFYNDALQALISHKGDVYSEHFLIAYNELMNKFTTESSQMSGSQRRLTGRVFTEKQKSSAVLGRLLAKPITCDICGGMLDLEQGVQHDHFVQWSDGGATMSSNQRVAHPFCNNQRSVIEGYMNKSSELILPRFSEPDMTMGERQLSMFPDEAFR